jgi:hypothetical protein
MIRAGEHDGRTTVEVMLTALVLAAIVVPMAGGVALAEARTSGRRTRAAGVAREVLAHAVRRPLALLAHEFRPRGADGAGGWMPGHLAVARARVAGGLNPLSLPDELVRTSTQEGFEVRVYFDWARRGRARTPSTDSGTAWVDVLDSAELAKSGDPFRALLAHRAQSIIAPASSGHPGIRDVSL